MAGVQWKPAGATSATSAALAAAVAAMPPKTLRVHIESMLMGSDDVSPGAVSMWGDDRARDAVSVSLL